LLDKDVLFRQKQEFSRKPWQRHLLLAAMFLVG